MYIYTCQACEEGRHGSCELSHPAPPGVYGGSKCICPCRGNANWNKPSFIESELRKIVEGIGDVFKKGTEKPTEVDGPPKKIHLKQKEN